jgi:hypothetical protein
MVPAVSGQADVLVAKQLRPSRAPVAAAVVQHGAESQLAVLASVTATVKPPHAAIALAHTPWILAVR